jgi:hypothetical protein
MGKEKNPPLILNKTGEQLRFEEKERDGQVERILFMPTIQTISNEEIK